MCKHTRSIIHCILPSSRRIEPWNQVYYIFWLSCTWSYNFVHMYTDTRLGTQGRFRKETPQVRIAEHAGWVNTPLQLYKIVPLWVDRFQLRLGQRVKLGPVGTSTILKQDLANLSKVVLFAMILPVQQERQVADSVVVGVAQPKLVTRRATYLHISRASYLVQDNTGAMVFATSSTNWLLMTTTYY